jgi:ribosomal protein S18 acetylase RimI-like enzyme
LIIGGGINGFLVGTVSSENGRNNFIKDNKFALTLRVLWLCFKFDKSVWLRVFKFIRSMEKKLINKKYILTSESSRLNEGIIRLLSICVSKNSRCKGIAKEMVEEFERLLIDKGYKGYALTVYKSNINANIFYKKIDMKIYKKTRSIYKYRKNLVN